jgi:hypothetical protein
MALGVVGFGVELVGGSADGPLQDAAARPAQSTDATTDRFMRR